MNLVFSNLGIGPIRFKDISIEIIWLKWKFFLHKPKSYPYVGSQGTNIQDNTMINCQLELVPCPSHFGMKKPFYQPNKKNKK